MRNRTYLPPLGKIPSDGSGVLVGKILGSLVSDGCIYRRYLKKYPTPSKYFELTDEWKESVKLVSDWVEQLTGLKGSISPHKGGWRYRLGSRDLVDYLHSLDVPYGEKSSTIEVPSQILDGGERLMLPFMTAVFIFDGTVKLDGTFEFCTNSQALRDQISSFLKKENLHVWEFEKPHERWSNRTKYGFSSRSHEFFLKILEGPKKTKLEIIRNGRKASFQELSALFPRRSWSRAPCLEEAYVYVGSASPSKLKFNDIKRHIENKHGLSMHRNTLTCYLNLLVKSGLVRRENGLYSAA